MTLKLTRTGLPDASVCTSGEDINFAVRDRSLDSISPAQDMSTTFSSTRWGNCAVKTAAMPPPCCTPMSDVKTERKASTDHGIPNDNGFVPLQVLHQKCELRGIEVRVVCRLWCVRVSTAI